MDVSTTICRPLALLDSNVRLRRSGCVDETCSSAADVNVVLVVGRFMMETIICNTGEMIEWKHGDCLAPR